MKLYKNGNISVLIGTDGTKIRLTNDDEFIPKYAENCDVKITDKCGQNCPFCYEGCSSKGEHALLLDWKFLDTLHPYTELALNGNDLDHPQLEEFLIKLKDKNVFANITVNQNQFYQNYDKIKEWKESQLIWGVGVSLQKATDELIEKISSIDNTVLHTIVGLLTEDEILKLKDKDLRVLILGYKTLQRGFSYKEKFSEVMEANKDYLKNNLKSLINYFKVLSFDNLALEQLNVKSILSPKEWERFYMGDDGDFTFYIDLVKGEYARNSISMDRYPIGDLTVDEMFNNIKNTKKNE